MIGQPAARVGDKILCSLPNPVPPGPPTHTLPPGHPIKPPGCPSVKIDGKAAARVTDKSFCDGPSKTPVPNPILQGAFPVRIGNLPAARFLDLCAHPGSLVFEGCCDSVLIGMAGTSGNPWAGTDECEKAKQGRNPPGKDGQSYGNCGVETNRQIINRATNKNVSEDRLLHWAINNKLANGGRLQRVGGALVRGQKGGTMPAQCSKMLNKAGVGAFTTARHSVNPNALSNMLRHVASGRGVNAAVMAGTMWRSPNLSSFVSNPPAPGTGGHAILVTGAEYDENGNVTHVIINDTGIGVCGQRVDYATFKQAFEERDHPVVVTRKSIW